jgi:hypothetical protein
VLRGGYDRRELLEGFMARRLGALLLIGALASTSCGVTVQGSAAASGSSAATPVAPARGDWVTGEDPASGVRFSLPGKATVQKRPGNDGTPDGRRIYLYQAPGDIGVSVAVVDGAVEEAYLDVLPDELVKQFHDAGAPDAQVGERRRNTIEGRPALDFQLSFTAKNGKRSFWLTQEIAGERHLIVLQTIGFSDTADAAFENLVRDYHRQLVAGLRLH